MLDTLILALNACVPYLVYLLIGYVGRERKLADEDFYNTLNTFAFKAFFPCLLFYNFYNIDTSTDFDHRFWVFCLCIVIGVILVLCAVVPLFVKDRSKVATIIQAIFRSNYLLFGVPMAESLFGEQGAELGAVVLAIVIPTYNASSVIILESFRGGKISPLQLLWKVLTTPLVFGALVGAAFLFLRIPVPTCILNPIGKISALSTPIAIVTLGGTLHFNAIGKNMKYLVPSLIIKMGILPICMVMLAVALGFGKMERFITLILFATPVAAASYPMARNLGGDGELAGQFVVISTVLAVGTMFLWIVVLRTAGII